MNEMHEADILRVLQTGTMDVTGLLPWSSNYAFLVRLCLEGVELEAVYKPCRGERPLWDFPQGSLCKRELSAYLVSTALGWHLVPPTVLRDGPNGPGSVQLFIDHDPEKHYFTIEGEEIFARQLQKFVLFDVVINNADRKAGHVLRQEIGDSETEPDRLWAIDHGVSFHTDHKLRTVIWEFAGAPIPGQLLQELERFRTMLLADVETTSFQQQLRPLLTKFEITAMKRRLNRLMEPAVFPSPGPGRHYPWPPV